MLSITITIFIFDSKSFMFKKQFYSSKTFLQFYIFCMLFFFFDWSKYTIQVAKRMTEDLRDNSQCGQSSQQSRQGPTKYQTDLNKSRTEHRPEHQMFFLLVFLKDKIMFVNKLGSLWGSK